MYSVFVTYPLKVEDKDIFISSLILVSEEAISEPILPFIFVSKLDNVPDILELTEVSTEVFTLLSKVVNCGFIIAFTSVSNVDFF